MHNANLKIIYKWILKAWNEFKVVLIQSSFKRIRISNNQDETESDYLFMNQSENKDEDQSEFDNMTKDITVEKWSKIFT